MCAQLSIQSTTFKGLKMKSAEERDDEGWVDVNLKTLKELKSDLHSASYELEYGRRGIYTNAHTPSELAEYFRELAEELEDVAEELDSYEEDD